MPPSSQLLKNPFFVSTSTFTNTKSCPSPHLVRQQVTVLTLCLVTLLLPIGAQAAALPAAIQSALTRAGLSPADISIVIKTVGDKNISYLPAPIQVFDNPSAITDPIVRSNNANNLSLKNHHKGEQRDGQQPVYTDDPDTLHSLQSMPLTFLSNKHKVNKSIKSRRLLSPTPVVSHQPNVARLPASTMKLIPSFIALNTLGADFIWHTRVYHTGLIINHHLYGDLIVQGSGDPKMTHERVQQLLYQVKHAGIWHISGNIILDSAVFNNVSKDPAAFDHEPLRPYNASPDGFLVNFSSLGIHSYLLNNNQAQLVYTPKLGQYQLPATVGTRTAPCLDAKISLAPQWQANRLLFHTKLPDSCGEHLFYIAYPNAKDFAARVVASKWRQLGNSLSGNVLAQEQPYHVSYYPFDPVFNPSIRLRLEQPERVKIGLAALPISPLPITSYPSLRLAQQIYDINHFSNNVMTEQVTLSLGAYYRYTGTPKDPVVSTTQFDNPNSTSLYQLDHPMSDYPAALQSINQWWKAHLTTPPPHLTNGSGLCRECRITAANISELLTYAYGQPNFDVYVNSLGVAGVSGTIAAHRLRMPESAAIGRAWIKTGTLNNVTAMAGYVKGQSGQDYTVVGLINTKQALNPSTARPVLDAMLDWTARH